jgi:hypothetical protein
MLLDNSLAETLGIVEQECSRFNKSMAHRQRLTKLLTQNWSKLKFGFSHGDLWCQDILMAADGRFCILDWEWSSVACPVGIDMFHLAVTTLKYYYQISLEASITMLFCGKGRLEQMFRQQIQMTWNKFSYDVELRMLSVILYLIHIRNRNMNQVHLPFSAKHHDVAGVLAMAITSPSYLASLVLE